MRKRIISTSPPGDRETSPDWLPLEQIASVEVTSKESARPVEDALLPGSETGWRAALPGAQTLRRIWLRFIEREVERSQEFVLRWSADGGRTFHEIVRQQWNVNLHDSAEEVEDYPVELSGVTQLELKIVPDRSGGDARAIPPRLMRRPDDLQPADSPAPAYALAQGMRRRCRVLPEMYAAKRRSAAPRHSTPGESCG